MARRPQFSIFRDAKPVSDAQVAKKLLKHGKPLNRSALQRRENVQNPAPQIPAKPYSAESSDDSLELTAAHLSQNTFLHAVTHGEYSTVRQYLLQPDAEADIQRPVNEDTALHIALRGRPSSWLLIVQALAKAGANFLLRNAVGDTPIALVCQCLRDHNAGVLTGARRLNKKETDFLVQLAREQFFVAVRAGDVDTVSMLLKTQLIKIDRTDDWGFSALDWAVAERDQAMCEVLLSWNASWFVSVKPSVEGASVEHQLVLHRANLTSDERADYQSQFNVLNALVTMLETGAASNASSRTGFFKKVNPYEASVHTLSLWMVVIKAVYKLKDDERFTFDPDAFDAQLHSLFNLHAKGADNAYCTAAQLLLDAPLEDVILAYQRFSLVLSSVLEDSSHPCYAFAEEMHRRFSNLAGDEYQSASLLDGILMQQESISDFRA